MVTILQMLLETAALASTPLQPIGNWTVAYEESMCLVSRKFGQAGEVALLLRPSPLAGDVEVTFIQSNSTDRRVIFDREASLNVAPAGQTIDTTYRSWWSPSQKGRIAIVYASEPLLDLLNDGTVLSFQARGERTLSVAMRNLEKLKPVIEDCKKTVAKHWGIDLVKLRAIATPATPLNPKKLLVTSADYPEDALRKGISGTVTLLWTIGTDGKVSEGKILSTSGTPSLDNAGCRAVKARGTYLPARDAAGEAVPYYGMRRINWLIPRS